VIGQKFFSQAHTEAASPSETQDKGQREGKRHPVLGPRFWKISLILVTASLVGVGSAAVLPQTMAIAAGLTVFCIGFWALSVAPEYWPALAFFAIAILSDIAPAQTIFSGFQSSTFWLLFSGIILGASIRHTGLGQHIAVLLSQILGQGYARLISGIVLLSLALAFVMPSSMGRVALLIPIILVLADHMGYGPDSSGRIGMVLAAGFGTCLPAFTILPANAPNMILAGMAESLYGQHLSYWEYLLLHFPVLGAVKAGILILLILWMFPDHAPQPQTTSLSEEKTVLTFDEYHLLVILGLCLAFWFTDGLHHISPGWIGLVAALYCLWPETKLTSAKCLNQEVNYGALFFVAAIIGLGAVISATGLGQALTERLSDYAGFDPGRPLWNVVVLTALSTVVAIMTSLPGVPTVMTPMAQDIATLTALPLTTILMTQVLAFSNILLPYQAAPIVAMMQIGAVPVRAVVKLCLLLFVIGLTLLIPLDLLWWHVLGKF